MNCHTLSRRLAPAVFGMFLFAVGVFSGSAARAADSWETMTPSGTSGYVFTTSVAIDDTVFLGTDHGVYRSVDRGANWTHITSGLTNQTVRSIAIGWTFNISTYVFEANSSTPVFVGTAGGVFKGTMDGSSWTAINSGLSDTNVKDIEIDQSNFTELYAATPSGVFRSDDGGTTWALKNSGMEGKSVIKIVSDYGNLKLYALTADNILYVSDLYSVSLADESWSVVSNASLGATMNDVSLLNARGYNVWLGTTGGVRKSDSLGTSWSSQNGGFSSSVVSMVTSDYLETNIAYAALTGGGVYRMTNEASGVWAPINTGLSDLATKEVCTNPTLSTLVYAVGGSGFYRLVLSDPYVDIASPTSAVVLSDADGVVKSGNSLTLTATFSEPLQDSPIVKIALSGATTLSPTNMIKTDTTHYSYVYAVGSGNGAVNITFSVGTDAAGNVVAATPTSGLYFTLDNTAPNNQNVVFASSVSKQSGASVAIVSSDDATNAVWFAPSGTTNFSAGDTMTTAGGTATSILAPTSAGSYKLFVIDTTGNVSSASSATLTVDNIAPSLSAGAPSGTLSSGTTSMSLSLTTNENATCKYATVAGTAYASMTNTFGTTGSTTHSTSLSGLSNGTAYVYYVRCADATGNANGSDYPISFSVDTPVVVADTTPPTVSLTAPSNGASVSGTVSVSASASDDVGVVGVQFKLDGAALGAEVLSSPYSMSWDTTTASNGAHALTATARDAAGNPTVSSAVSVTVGNTSTPSISDSNDSSSSHKKKKKKKSGGSTKISSLVKVRAGDRVAPFLTVSAPRVGTSVLTKKLSIFVNARDASGVRYVVFSEDGVKVKKKSVGSTLVYTYSGSKLKKNTTVYVVAIDTFGNRKTCAIVLQNRRVAGIRYY